MSNIGTYIHISFLDTNAMTGDEVSSSVADPNTLNFYPDPGFWPNLDPDPSPDPDPTFYNKF